METELSSDAFNLVTVPDCTREKFIYHFATQGKRHESGAARGACPTKNTKLLRTGDSINQNFEFKRNVGIQTDTPHEVLCPQCTE